MARPDRDLFDDSTMSFGEHLEELRDRLIKAIYGIVVGTVIGLFFGGEIVSAIREPLSNALRDYQYDIEAEQVEAIENRDLGDWLYDQFQLEVIFGRETPDEANDTSSPDVVSDSVANAVGEAEQVPVEGEDGVDPDPRLDDAKPGQPEVMELSVNASDLLAALHAVDPERFPAVASESAADVQVPLRVYGKQAARLQAAVDSVAAPVTLTVQEAFMTYLKVSLIAGLIISSPWTFLQMWLFVAAGLYPHERAWVRRYGWLSLLLFLGGALFCFKLVLPFALNFLLGFNEVLGITPNIRLTEWISFATFIPILFGLSFQLPIVMLVIERLGILTQDDFREKRRIAILVIAVVSMLLTPQDPTTMIFMMIPLTILYEFGIMLCDWTPPANPFDDAIVVAER